MKNFFNALYISILCALPACTAQYNPFFIKDGGVYDEQGVYPALYGEFEAAQKLAQNLSNGSVEIYPETFEPKRNTPMYGNAQIRRPAPFSKQDTSVIIYDVYPNTADPLEFDVSSQYGEGFEAEPLSYPMPLSQILSSKPEHK